MARSSPFPKPQDFLNDKAQGSLFFCLKFVSLFFGQDLGLSPVTQGIQLASALPLSHPELAGVAFVAASVQIHRYPRADHFLSPIFTQFSVGPTSLPAAVESQGAFFRAWLEMMASNQTSCSRLAGAENPITLYAPGNQSSDFLPSETCLPLR